MSNEYDADLDIRLEANELQAGDLQRLLKRNPRLRGYASVNQEQRRLQKPRLTVTEVCYYQEPDGQPVNFDGSYTALLESTDQPCPPKITVGGSWQALNRLWLEKCSCLCLRNEEGRFQVRPTPEQLAEVQARVVEVSLVQPLLSDWYSKLSDTVFGIIRPGRSLRLEPENLGRYRLRCRAGTAKVAVMAFPK